MESLPGTVTSQFPADCNEMNTRICAMKCPKCGEKLQEIRPSEGPENKPRYMCPAPDCGFVGEVEELSEDKPPDTP